MKLSVNSEETTAFRVSIDMTDKEKADFIQEGIVTFSLCIARLIGELVQDSCESTEQAKALAAIINTMSKDMVDEYIDGVFDEVKQIREETELYSYMEDMFDAFLKEIGSTREDFLEKYKDSKTLTVEPVLGDETVTIVLQNGVVGDIMEDFPIAMIEEDPETFHRVTAIAHMSATVAGDLIFGEDANPIRSLDMGPECDGGLSAEIEKMLH